MGIAGGPNLNQDGLVFLYDVFDQDNSYKGEPTVNLLYSAGATNLINGAGDIYVRCTKTDLGNGKYRFVNNGTGASTVRVYTNQADLINGATYGCSVYFEDLIGAISIDWCDTGITGVNYSTSTSGRLNGYGTRATYDGPYYFLDINLDSGGAATIFNPQVEQKSHATTFTSSARSATQGLLDVAGTTQIDLSNVSFDANAQMYFDGTNDYVDISSAANLEIVDNVTVEAILKVNTSNLGAVKVIANKYSGTGWEFVLGSAGNFAFSGRNGDGTYYSSDSSTIIADNQYHHIVGIKTGLYWKAYVDGILKSTLTAGSIGTLYNTTAMQLGREGSYYYTDMYLNGFKVYNRALTNEEVLQNYNATKSRLGLK